MQRYPEICQSIVFNGLILKQQILHKTVLKGLFSWYAVHSSEYYPDSRLAFP